MKPTQSHGIVSFITQELIHTLLDLLKKLRELPEQPPGDVKAGFREVGYSASIIVLAVTILESAITRFRYLKADLTREPGATDYFIASCSDKLLSTQVNEIVAVRDSIVHSHIWKGPIYWDEQGQLKFHSPPRILPEFGNRRHKKVINQEKRATTKLELNLYPPRLWRRDAFLVIQTLGLALDYMNKIEHGLGADEISWFGDGWPTNLREIAKSLIIPDYR